MAGKSATDFDKRLGARVTEARKAAKMSQRSLAEKLDVSAAQLQKYEAGVNCMNAGTLQLVARAFEMSVLAFYDPEPEGVTGVQALHQALACLETATHAVQTSAEALASATARRAG